MKPFLTFHNLQGQAILIRPEFIQVVMPKTLQIQTGPAAAPTELVNCTMLLCQAGQLAIMETVEEVEDAMKEPDFGA